MANIAVEGILMKEEPIMIFHNSKFFVSIIKSLFINLCDSFNKDGPSFPDVLVPVSVNSWTDEK